MPTGYTACIDDGGTFEDYVWSCARAFFREGEIKEPEVDTYRLDRIESKKKRLAELEAQDPVQEYENWFKKATEENARYLANNKAVREKYSQVRMLVADWSPPTPVHENMKAFMLEQLATGCEPDMSGYYENKPEREDPYLWHKEQIETTRKWLTEDEESLRKHLKHVESGKQWLAQLEQSVPQPKGK